MRGGGVVWMSVLVGFFFFSSPLSVVGCIWGTGQGWLG